MFLLIYVLRATMVPSARIVKRLEVKLVLILIVFMELRSENWMRIINLFLRKILLALKTVYWVWLIFCFFDSFRLFLSVALNYRALSKLFDFLIIDSEFGGYLSYSSIFTPIVFIIVSITRRKILAWEFCLITVTWGLMFYVFSHASS